MKDIYNMKLHEQIRIDEHVQADLFTVCTRVAGGWIYSQFDKATQIGSSVFVPYNYEFNKEKPNSTSSYGTRTG